jgi:hypothetical protein
MRSRLAWVVVSTLLICAGCGREPRGGPRVETFPVTGTVLVNGTPAAGLLVAGHPQGESEIKHRLACNTDDQGKFTLGTYESADGLPEGQYKLTFEWMEGTMLGPETDKLKGAYADPKESQYSVTVTSGEENDLGDILLTTK